MIKIHEKFEDMIHKLFLFSGDTLMLSLMYVCFPFHFIGYSYQKASTYDSYILHINYLN